MRYLQLTHAIPGRTRLRCPTLRRDGEAIARVADALAAVAGVHEVKVRPYTGSVLVHHEPAVAPNALVDVMRGVLGIEHVLGPNELPPQEGAIPELSKIAKLAATAFRELDRDILAATRGSFDLGTLATLGFFGAGALGIAAERTIELPPWFNLAWWGYRTFMTSEQDEIEWQGEEGVD
jgi:heavy-metal-associated domain-containing protein